MSQLHTHNIYDDGFTPTLCLRCKMEGDSALASVECGKVEEYRAFKKKQSDVFNQVLSDAEIHLAIEGVRPLNDKAKIPRLQEFMKARFLEMTDITWDEAARLNHNGDT